METQQVSLQAYVNVSKIKLAPVIQYTVAPKSSDDTHYDSGDLTINNEEWSQVDFTEEKEQ